MMRNIEAVQVLSKMTRTALGPHGKFNFVEILILVFAQFRNEQNGHQPSRQIICHK
jgi:hypothetical protein